LLFGAKWASTFTSQIKELVLFYHIIEKTKDKREMEFIFVTLDNTLDDWNSFDLRWAEEFNVWKRKNLIHETQEIIYPLRVPFDPKVAAELAKLDPANPIRAEEVNKITGELDKLNPKPEVKKEDLGKQPKPEKLEKNIGELIASQYGLIDDDGG